MIRSFIGSVAYFVGGDPPNNLQREKVAKCLVIRQEIQHKIRVILSNKLDYFGVFKIIRAQNMPCPKM